jgi:ribosomal protein S12 methylthiotransferase
MTVLVEGKAGPGDLPAANISSWEHGLIRSASALGQANAGHRADEFLVARSQADAPDIDGRVYVAGNAAVGQFARVRIIGHTDYDLVARVLA